MSDIQSTYDMSDKNETNRRICKTAPHQRQQLLDAEIISVDYAALRQKRNGKDLLGTKLPGSIWRAILFFPKSGCGICPADIPARVQAVEGVLRRNRRNKKSPSHLFR